MELIVRSIRRILCQMQLKLKASISTSNCFHAATEPLDCYPSTALLTLTLADPNRHIRKKKLRDLHNKIRKVQLRMHNRKAKRSIPKLQAKLSALEKQTNEVMRGNFQHIPKRVATPKVCQVCGGPVSIKGYHICKPGTWRKH